MTALPFTQDVCFCAGLAITLRPCIILSVLIPPGQDAVIGLSGPPRRWVLSYRSSAKVADQARPDRSGSVSCYRTQGQARGKAICSFLQIGHDRRTV